MVEIMENTIKMITDRLDRIETKQDMHMESTINIEKHLAQLNGSVRANQIKIEQNTKCLEDRGDKSWEITKGFIFACIGGLVSIGSAIILGWI